MTPERWHQTKELLESALERDPAERVGFLDEACVGDEELRHEVESLLSAHEQAGDFIQAPAVEFALELMAGPDPGSKIGQTIGPYKVVNCLGAGGMGEVYLAQDMRLDRKIALKLLPVHLTRDGDSMRRFVQEAKAASALSHPNVAHIYEIGEADGFSFIAMEYVEGQTLEARIRNGPLDCDEVVDIGIQVAKALQEAHSKGIIHRDIKPANIVITPKGLVKVLDFGLAKVTRNDGPLLDGDSSRGRRTQPGVVMGTVGYMSPEQVRGQVADHRSDIFSFGVILYEMLSGHRPFKGESNVEVMNAILKEEPPAPQETNGAIPPALQRVIRHCLEKKPDARFQSMSDVAFDLEGLSMHRDSTWGAAVPISGRAWSRAGLVWIVVGGAVLAALTLGLRYFQRAPAEVHPVRAFILPPENSSFNFAGANVGPLVVSPDGRLLAFVASTAEGKKLLWVRSLDSLSARTLAGTEDALYPFWSPDSRSLGFFADGKLKKIDAAGGPALALCDAPAGRGGTWNRDDVIVFAPNKGNTPLHRVSASGGVAVAVTEFDEARGEKVQHWPFFLPDGQHFLYFGKPTGASGSEDGGIYVASLQSKQGKLLIETRSNPAYAEGYLLFLREGVLMAQRFDPERLEVAGDAFPIAEQIQYSQLLARGVYSVSENGVLAYQAGDATRDSQLTWFDRLGKPLGVLGDPVPQGRPHLSPNGKTAIVEVLERKTKNQDIWIYELARGLRTRFTFNPANEESAIWSADGSQIAFTSNRAGHNDLYRKASNGTGSEELLLESDIGKFPDSWSPDGRFLLYHVADDKTISWDLWILPLSEEGESKIYPSRRKEPYPFLQTEFRELHGQFSPDGRWIAYQSNESGTGEIYVASFPGAGNKRQISTSGGLFAKWRGDGKEIFYLSPDNHLMAVEVSGAEKTFKVGSARRLFELRWVEHGRGPVYDVTSDGQRFLVNTVVEQRAPSPITLVTNWTADLKK
ncbi:MAG: serine/threonine-protein kinase [Acidobacteria bacterium]|nr:serine/threonine-protein kinase [Acidobacteriota bacterium]